MPVTTRQTAMGRRSDVARWTEYPARHQRGRLHPFEAEADAAKLSSSWSPAATSASPVIVTSNKPFGRWARGGGTTVVDPFVVRIGVRGHDRFDVEPAVNTSGRPYITANRSSLSAATP
jgi:hypothetical protein